jgi:hypothetical protein
LMDDTNCTRACILWGGNEKTDRTHNSGAGPNHSHLGMWCHKAWLILQIERSRRGQPHPCVLGLSS